MCNLFSLEGGRGGWLSNKTNYAIHGGALRTRVKERRKEGRKEEARRKGNQYTAGGGGRIIVDKSKLAFSFARSSFTGICYVVRCSS